MPTRPGMYFCSHCSLLAGWHFLTFYFLFLSWLSLQLALHYQHGFHKCWLMPALPVWPYGPSVQLAAPAIHKNALSLMVWAKTVGISNTATQFISNLFNPVYTRLHCSVTNSSNELNCSSGWKRTDMPLNHTTLQVRKQNTTSWLSHPFYPAAWFKI